VITVRHCCVAAALLALVSCKHKHAHEEGGHTHDQGAQAGPDAEKLSRSATVWTDTTELFVEYPALIVGRESAFAAHLTDLATFKPLTAGTVIVTVTMGDGTAVSGRAPGPSNPGIFRPTVKPSRPGLCTLPCRSISKGLIPIRSTLALATSTPTKRRRLRQLRKRALWRACRSSRNSSGRRRLPPRLRRPDRYSRRWRCLVRFGQLRVKKGGWRQRRRAG
jgi:hypothetical protein